ncbi:hypothetical protein ASPCADRAFT_514793 [Aspergillus carbonarius ITEM 5010]|uniref:Uncharacterized protein n=1 Tax=Aspergillus carbonarius (strain ITEM 5010) TaxID=602072 RepID=A0A1R3RPW0_ASPC5|nr:hypothetical protein ASPCADRAFT_514793 [Aspergillus carbonarius ITEM 5010]
MVSKAIGCLHLPKLSSYQPSPSCDWGQLTLPVMFSLNLPRLGPWGCNMDFSECRVFPTVSTGDGLETANVFDPGLVRNELLQTFPPHLTRVTHWFLGRASNRPKRLSSPSSLSRLPINPPRSRTGALNPTVISLTWTSGTLG